MNDSLQQREETKRERQWNPLQRWRALQTTIAWAEAQTAVRRNTPAACLRIERRHRTLISSTLTAQP